MKVTNVFGMMVFGLFYFSPAVLADHAGIDVRPKVSRGTFILSNFEDDVHLSHPCRLYVELNLRPTIGSFGVAELKDLHTGACFYTGYSNRRVYRVKAEETGCGSLKLVSRGIRHAEELNIIDHRTRLCDDYRPFMIELTEELKGGVVREYVGNQKIDPLLHTAPIKAFDAKRATIEGVLDFTASIGGETTGFIVEGKAQSVEVDLSVFDQEEIDAMMGRFVKVEGEEVLVKGVERGEYPVLIVSKAEVLN